MIFKTVLTEVAGEGGPHLAPQKFLLSQKNFQLSTVHKSEDRGGMKMPYDFFVYICDF